MNDWDKPFDTPAELRLPWEQRDNEGAKPFAAFNLYLSLPPLSRSVDAAFRRRFGGNSTASGRAPSAWWHWFRDFEWSYRARIFDENQLRILRRARDEERRENFRALRGGQQSRASTARLLHNGLARVLAVNISRLAAQPPELSIPQIGQLLSTFVRLGHEISEAQFMADGLIDYMDELDRQGK